MRQPVTVSLILNLKRPSHRILYVLKRAPYGLHFADILERTKTTPSVLGYHLKRLQKEGLVEKRGDRYFYRGGDLPTTYPPEEIEIAGFKYRLVKEEKDETPQS